MRRTRTCAVATPPKTACWKDDAMLAATPPLEAARLLFPDLARSGRGCARGRCSGARKALLADVRERTCA
eukprot:12496549-Alexandrium_andersonii.AAC.1